MGYKSSVVLVALFIVAAAVLILHLSDQSMTSASDMAQKYSCLQTGSPEGNNMTYKIDKTDEEWKAVLTPEQYRITRQKGTERAFTGEFYDHHENGTYRCVCCGAELFSSNEKYDSGSGWPSFWGLVSPDNISELSDNSLGMSRTEVLCSQCGSHLGHVFDDGPKPTGLRYCVNSASLKFDPDSSEAD